MLIDQESLMAIQPELVSGESVLWAGRPSSSVVFHNEDRLLVPFSLMWGGFAVFWEMGVTGYWGSNTSHTPPVFMMLWGVPFVVMGQYLIWGRFFYAAWKKKKTHYAVTNRRVIAVQNCWKHQVASAYIDSLPALIKEKRSGEFGTLRFAPAPELTAFHPRRRAAWDALSIADGPVFVDIDDVDSVYQLISALRDPR